MGRHKGGEGSYSSVFGIAGGWIEEIGSGEGLLEEVARRHLPQQVEEGSLQVLHCCYPLEEDAE